MPALTLGKSGKVLFQLLVSSKEKVLAGPLFRALFAMA